MKKSIWMVLSACIALASCATETEVVPGNLSPATRPVVFSQTTGAYAATRAMTGHPVENDHSDEHKLNAGLIPVTKSFGVHAWKHSAAATPVAYAPLNNMPVTRGGTDALPTYTYADPAAQWPDATGDQLSFLAYYPYMGDNSAKNGDAVAAGLTAPVFGLDGDDEPQMTISYTTPTAGDKHIDLMYAAKPATAYVDPGTVSLTFRHALARMQFSARIKDFPADSRVTVTGIKLKGAVLEGTLSVSGATDTAWPDPGTTNDPYTKPVWILDKTTTGDITATTKSSLELDQTMQSVIHRTDMKTPDVLSGKGPGDLLILPQSTLDLALEVTIALNGTPVADPYTIPLSGALDLEMNWIYNFGLTLTPHHAKVDEVVVLPWGEGGTGQSQFSGQYSLWVDRSLFEFGYAEGSETLNIATDYDGALFGYSNNPGWFIRNIVYTPANVTGWLTAPTLSTTGGTGTPASPTPTPVTVAANTGGERSATFDVVAGNMSKTITVNQVAKPTITAEPAGVPWSAGERDHLLITYTGGASDWHVESISDPWLYRVDKLNNNGVRLFYTENTNTLYSRYSDVTLKDDLTGAFCVFRVTQAKAPAPYDFGDPRILALYGTRVNGWVTASHEFSVIVNKDLDRYEVVDHTGWGIHVNSRWGNNVILFDMTGSDYYDEAWKNRTFKKALEIILYFKDGSKVSGFYDVNQQPPSY